MKIVQLTTVHRWDDVRIYHKICSSLAAAGHDVHLVAPDPGTPEAPEPPDISIHLLPASGSRPTRLLNAWRAVGVVRRIRPDVVHFHDPELMPTAMVLRLLGIPVVYDVHEDLPEDILQKEWIVGALRRPMSLIARLSEWMFTRTAASAVVPVTEHIARRFPSSRTVVVQNYPLLGELLKPAGSGTGADSAPFVFIGGITRDRGGLQMIEAASLAAEDGDSILVDLVGPVVPPAFANELESAAKGTPARLVGTVSREQVGSLLSTARASFILFHPAPNHINAQPNKLFEAMSAGVPVIASDFPAWRRIVDGERCGMLVDPLDPAAIARAMRTLLENPDEAESMGRRGRKAVEHRFNWESESARLLDLYASLERGDPIA